MKAFSCSQCGALVKQISLPEKFAFCDDCGAKILIQDDKDTTASFVPEFKLIENESLSETLVDMMGVESDREELGERTKKVLIILTILFVIFMPFILVKKYSKETERSQNQTSVAPIPPPTQPELSYRSSVEYDPNVGADSVKNPVINLEKLSTNDINELKKAVFAPSKIFVQLVIGENGSVISAKGLNGHPVLQESSVEAAKRSLFSARKRKTTTVFTYIYILN